MKIGRRADPARRWPLRFVSVYIFLVGLSLVIETLFFPAVPEGRRMLDYSTRVSHAWPILGGMLIIYLAFLIRKRKRSAWWIVTPLSVAYFISVVIGVVRGIDTSVGIGFFQLTKPHHLDNVINLAISFGMTVSLLYYKHLFTVKSGITNVSDSIRRSIIILAIGFLYGFVGFQLADTRYFHREITLPESALYTIDQFEFTGNQNLHPYTKRARLFLDSLGVISGTSLFLAVISFFQPFKSRFIDPVHDREEFRQLLDRSPMQSEDFFKLWPQDKHYYFSPKRGAGLAYKAVNGIALQAGDPVGSPKEYGTLLRSFYEQCRINDWLPSVIHCDENLIHTYKELDFQIQKIGEEAVVDTKHFQAVTSRDKHFRHIRNKFEKLRYTIEYATPPHSTAVMSAVKRISDDWTKLPGRSERGFLMGYHTEAYLQQCSLVLVRDEAQQIVGFLNQVPTYQQAEANFDFIRHLHDEPTNINDFICMSFIGLAHDMGFKTVNLGLCPLSGLADTKDKNVIDNALQFVYANGDRFYSFSGLHRFKSKFEPTWRNRYIAYRDGIRGFTRTVNALNKAMKVK